MTTQARRWRRRILVAGVALVAGCQVVYWTEPSVGFSLLERLTPRLVYRVKTERPLVALTFDDGPHPTFTPQVLDILERHGAKATFFLIGERALSQPALVARIKGAGHEVGNHYFMDGTTLGHSDADFLGYLERTERAVGIDRAPKLFRPPGGVAWPGQLRLARSRGYVCVLGSAYPHDPVHPPVWYIRWLTSKNLAPGAIVILHDGISDPTRSIAALPAILAAGQGKGLQFVSVGALAGVCRRRGGDMSLFKLIGGVVSNVAIFGGLLFLPAGTLRWWRAWVFLGVVFVGAVASTVSLFRVNKGLLEERFKPPVQKGQPLADKIVVVLLLAAFVGSIAFIPLDVFRFHLTAKPGTVVSSLGLVLVVVGWWIMSLALRTNAFATPVVRHQEERQQTVIDSGVYGVVRHPMYAGAALLMVGIPLWLESYAGALLAGVPIATLAVRILVEEQFLRRKLAGYDAYTQRVRYRLIPYVW